MMGMGLLWLMRPFNPRFFAAFLEPVPFGLLAAWTLSNQLLALFATYCRAAGNEPFMGVSITSAVATLLGATGFGWMAGVPGITLWLAVHNAIFFVPWGWVIFRQVRATVVDE